MPARRNRAITATTLLSALARHFGYDLIPRRKNRHPYGQLAACLRHHRIDGVLDVGANTGQYAGHLRRWGYDGHIVSFEPQRDAYAALSRAATGDARWQVAPRMALGEKPGEAVLQLSAESDMASLLPQSALLRRISPSSKTTGVERVSVQALDAALEHIAPQLLRPFLKLDVQGFERQVLAGAPQTLTRCIGVQVEMSLVELYEGEAPYQTMLAQMRDLGFDLQLVFPGYFAKDLAQQLQFDGVFVRNSAR